MEVIKKDGFRLSLRYFKVVYNRLINLEVLYKYVITNIMPKKIEYGQQIYIGHSETETIILFDTGKIINWKSYKKFIYDKTEPIVYKINNFNEEKEKLEKYDSIFPSNGYNYMAPSPISNTIEDMKRVCNVCAIEKNLFEFSIKKLTCKQCSKNIDNISNEDINSKKLDEHVTSIALLKEENERFRRSIDNLVRLYNGMHHLLLTHGILKPGDKYKTPMVVESINKDSGLCLYTFGEAFKFANPNNKDYSQVFITDKDLTEKDLKDKYVIYYTFTSDINKLQKRLDKFVVLHSTTQYKLPCTLRLFININELLFDKCNIQVNNFIEEFKEYTYDVTKTLCENFDKDSIKICDNRFIQQFLIHVKNNLVLF